MADGSGRKGRCAKEFAAPARLTGKHVQGIALSPIWRCSARTCALGFGNPVAFYNREAGKQAPGGRFRRYRARKLNLARPRGIAMKLIISVLFLFCATAAFAQAYGTVLSNQPIIMEIPSHTEHASMHPLAAPQYILETSVPSYAQGIQPLWEFPLMSDAMPLGDVARELRRQHAFAKKAEKVLSDQR